MFRSIFRTLLVEGWWGEGHWRLGLWDIGKQMALVWGRWCWCMALV